ncbi:MAG TPA: ABC transporter ATP-binding protein [Stellaceae bacterium]|nr:ABC transporter ATP-binding protein [Stellaceae bacterium]
MATDETVIDARGLRKLYGAVAAVDGIDLTVRRGEIFGLLGPNGAGKTTTILMLLGLTEVSGGALQVHGLDPRRDPLAVKRRVAYLPDSVGFYDTLTARENLRYIARLLGLARGEVAGRIDDALRRVGLDGAKDLKTAAFSRGMKQRLGLAEVLLKGADIAILDEPTSGLDPQATIELLDIIRDMKRDGIAVLLSSHLLDRVQAVCDRVALFHQGHIVLQGTVAELAQQVLGGGFSLELATQGPVPVAAVASVPGVQRVVERGPGRCLVIADRELRPALARAVLAAGGALLQLVAIEPSLETIYRRYFEQAAHGQA